MNPKVIYMELYKLLDSIFASLRNHLKNEEAKTDNGGFFKWVSDDELNFTFKLAGYTFVIKGYINSLAGLIHLRTYEIVSDVNSYPNLRLNHIAELDIIGYINGFVRFVLNKQHEIMPQRFVPGTILEPTTYGLGYFHQLIAFIKRRELEEFESLKKIIEPFSSEQ